MTDGNDLKQLAYEFITTHRTAALSTVDTGGNPHVAPVFCDVRKDLSIYFSTRIEGRKFDNLTRRPVVAMAFISEDDVSVIQLTGKAERIENLEQEQSVLEELAKHSYRDLNWPMPTLKLLESGMTNQLAIIKVTPSEMVYANFSSSKKENRPPLFQKII